MADLVWSDQTIDDLDRISDYLITRSADAAERYINDIRQACRRLEEFPDSGRRYDPAYRILVVRNHVVFYRHDEAADEVVIQTIIDGRRDVEKVLAALTP